MSRVMTMRTHVAERLIEDMGNRVNGVENVRALMMRCWLVFCCIIQANLNFHLIYLLGALWICVWHLFLCSLLASNLLLTFINWIEFSSKWKMIVVGGKKLPHHWLEKGWWWWLSYLCGYRWDNDGQPNDNGCRSRPHFLVCNENETETTMNNK